MEEESESPFVFSEINLKNACKKTGEGKKVLDYVDVICGKKLHMLSFHHPLNGNLRWNKKSLI